MLEAEIIAHCAPTLAGIKTANMFTYTPGNRDDLQKEIEEENEKLNNRGVFVEVLRRSEHKALVYVYRKLQERFFENECFPHEVGLFLGYPLDDVTGFIEQKGKNYKCCGIWKVYGDEQQTRILFRKLKRCSEIYRRLFADGRSILQLTVAA